MKTLNLVRGLWIVLTNTLMIYLIWPRTDAMNQLRTAIGQQPTGGLWSALTKHPWVVVAILILLGGIIAEFLNVRIAAIVNVGYYLSALIVALVGISSDRNEATAQQIYLGIVLYAVPVAIIMFFDAFLYHKIFLHRDKGIGAAGTPASLR